MAKKIILALSALIFVLLLISAWPIVALQNNVKQYISLNLSKSEDELLIKNNAKKIIKNFEKINKNLKKIIFKNFSEDLSKILSHFLSEKNKSYLVILQNSDELRATGGFMGSYFFLEFSHGMLNLTPIQDIYTIAGQQKIFPSSPTGHYEYLSEGKGLLIQDSNWWADTPTSAQEILQLWQEIAQDSPFLDENRDISGIFFVNLNFIENLLQEIGPIKLADYEQDIDSENFAQIARADRFDFFAGSKEKANFLNHSRVAIENQISQLSAQDQLALLKLLLNNLESKNIQLYSLDDDLQSIWQKHHFAGQLIKRNPNSFYFYSVESNVGINKANRLVDREFHIYQDDEQVEEIKIIFSNLNQKPTRINTNPQLNTADHLAYVNYQRLYFSPETIIKRIQTFDVDQSNQEKSTGLIDDFVSRPYFNQDNQEFLEISFLVVVPEQSKLQILIDLETTHMGDSLEIQKQSGINEIPVYFYQNQELSNSWTLTRDELE